MSSLDVPIDASAAEATVLGAGTLFHRRYHVTRCLGTGGMGAIYEVRHTETERRCVLKTMLGTLLIEPEMRQRFRLEATVTANIESDHIVDVYDAGIDDDTGLPFLVMEYLRGETLAAHLSARGGLAAPETLLLLSQAALALERTHAAGIVHRDLKPENLFITQRDDGSPHLKLLDFGIAKIIAQSTNVNTTRSFGTPLYMSPEQIRGDGDIDGRADLYALGQLAYTMLVGHAYFEREAADVSSVYPLLLKVMQGAPVAPTLRAREHGVSLPAAFDTWFAKATHLDPSGRFDTASELISALASALGMPDSLKRDARLDVPNALPLETRSNSHEQVTLTGVAKSGNHDHPRPAPGRTRFARVALFGFAGIVAFAGYLSLKGLFFAKTLPASAVTAARVTSTTPMQTSSTTAAPRVPSTVPVVSASSETGASSGPITPTALAVRPKASPAPRPSATTRSTDQRAAKQAPTDSPYDPSDTR